MYKNSKERIAKRLRREDHAANFAASDSSDSNYMGIRIDYEGMFDLSSESQKSQAKTPLAEEEMKQSGPNSSAGSYMGVHVIGIGNATPRYMK